MLATLEDRALVERVPNKGAVVALVDMETTYRLYQVREALDGLAVRLAIANAGPPIGKPCRPCWASRSNRA